jgi:hypothetical protein
VAHFNPGAPDVVGLEFLPAGRGATTVAGALAAGATVVSTVTESVATARLALTSLTGSGGLVLDVYAGTAPGAVGARTVTTVYPTADDARVSWTTFVGGTTNLWSTVDEAPASAADGDGIRDPGATIGNAVAFRLGGLAGFAASRRIMNVRVNARAIGGSSSIGFLRGGTTHGAKTTGYNGTSFRNVTLDFGELCPWTGLPWTQTNLVDLSNGTASLRVARADSSAGLLVPQVSALQVQIIHYAETRAAFGVATTLSSVLDVALLTPGSPATAGWAKAAATTYTFVLRPRRLGGSTQSAAWVYQVGVRRPTEVAVGLNVGVDADGLPVLTGTAPNPLVSLTSPAFVLLVAGVVSLDSQPYGYRDDARDMASAGANSQTFTAPTTASYGVIRAAVRVPPGGSLARLRMEVRRVSDNVLMGTAVEVTREDALAGADLGQGLYLAQAQMGTPAALAAGITYRVLMSLVNGSDPWHVALLIGIAGNSGGGFQGTSGAATVNGSTSVGFAPAGGSDWMVQVGTLPAALPNAAASLETLPLAPPRVPGIG